jgi:hypothetical protein
MDHAVSYGTSTITVPVHNCRGLKIAALQLKLVQLALFWYHIRKRPLSLRTVPAINTSSSSHGWSAETTGLPPYFSAACVIQSTLRFSTMSPSSMNSVLFGSVMRLPLLRGGSA